MGVEIFAINADGEHLVDLIDCEKNASNLSGMKYVWKTGTENIQKAFNDLYVDLFDKYEDYEPEFYLKLGALDFTESRNALCVALNLEIEVEKNILPKDFKKYIKNAKWYNPQLKDFDDYNIEAAKGFFKICKRFNLGINFF